MFDVAKLIAEDEATKDLDIPFRFGKSFDVNLTLNDGKWQEIDSMEIWGLRIISDNAYSLNFVFSELYLPQGGEMFIYNKEGSMVYGPVTDQQNEHGRTFMTDIIQGESVVIQISLPQKTKTKPRITIQNVIHGYINSFESLGYGDSDQSSLCNGPARDAECYRSVIGDAIDGVAQILLANGTEWCSGALLNNTAQDSKPYVLTAFHCIDVGDPSVFHEPPYSYDYDENDGTIEQYEIDEAEEWLVRFGFKHASCQGSTLGISFHTYDDTHVRAFWHDTDFALVELQDNILADRVSVGDNVWLGWNRSASSPSKGYFLHHPEGDVMKYAYDGDLISETSYLNTSSGQNHWYSQLDIGLLEHGSSGSPLFDQNKRVVGQLHGGDPDCNGTKQYWHGCIHRSWTGGFTDTTRLSNWLNPTGSTATTLNSIRPSTPTPTYSPNIDIVCSSTSLSITNLTPGYSFNHWNGNNVTFSNNTSNPVQISPGSSGSGWVQAVVNAGTDTYTMTPMFFWVGVPDISNLEIDADDLSADGYSYADIDGANCRSALEYEWDLPNANDWDYDEDRHTCIDLEYVEIEYYEDPPASSEVIRVRGMNTCGVSDWLSTTVDDCGGYYMMFSPNPTTSETTLSIESTSAEEPFDDNVEWGIEVYDQFTLKEKKTKLKGKSTQIKTHGWKDGVYVVRVKYKDEILTGKLVVKQ